MIRPIVIVEPRRTSSLIEECPHCGWRGRRFELNHTYRPDGSDGVEPVDRCPKCGEEM